MSGRNRGLELVVVTDDEPFGAAVADAVETAPDTADVDSVDPGVWDTAADGAIVDGQIAGLPSVVEGLTTDPVPTVVLADSSTADVSRAVEAGATDVFPRTSAPEQCKLVVDRIASRTSEADRVGQSRGERPYHEVFENVSDGLVVHELETGEILDVNERFCGMTGYSRDELVGETVDLVTPPDVESEYERAKERVREARDGGSQLFEWRNQRKNGETYPVEVHLSLVELHGDTQVLASVRDITERKRREREYEQIFNGVPDPITVNDPDTGEIVEVNDALCETLGYDKETVLEKGNEGLALNEEGYTGERAAEIVSRVMETGEPETFEWKLEAADGSHRVLEVTGKPAEINGERRYVSLTRDVTEQRKRAQEYEQIFNKVSDAIAVFDPESGDILDVNDPYREMVGYDLERIRELGIDGLSATDEGYTGERGERLIREVGKTGESTTVEWRAEKRDGDRIWLEATLAPAEIGGKQRVLSIQRDITERRELERTYQNIFENVSDGLVVHDPETGEILEVNEQYCELTGYSRDELVGETIEIIVPDDPEYTYEGAMARVREAREGGPQLFEFKSERKDGGTFVGDINLKTVDIRGEERVLASVRDVTERKRRKREYEQIFNGVNDSIVIQDPETAEPLEANETFLNRLGYDDIDEIQDFEQVSAADAGYTKQRAQELCQRVMETGESEVVEWKQQTKDGQSRWIEAQIDTAVIQGEDRVLSMQRDITERKRRERAIQALQRATEQLQTAQTPADVASIAVDTISDMLDLPVAVCWLPGTDQDQLDPVAVTGPAQERYRDWTVTAGDYEFEVCRDGELTEYTPSEHHPERSLDTGVVLPLRTNGLVVAGSPEETEVDQTVLDVAKALADHVQTALDRVEREQAVRESERRFRLIAERIDEVIYLAEPDFSDVLYVNPAYEDVWGQPVDALDDDARAFLDPIDERDRDGFESALEEMLTEMAAGNPQESYEFEFRLRNPNAGVRWITANGYAVDLPGGKRRFVGIAEDITDRKRREQRLEVFNRILRHNLRNQLDVIRSHAEVLAEETDGSYAERIIASVDELASIGAEARQTDKIMSMDDTLTEVDLTETVADVVDRIHQHDDVEIRLDLPPAASLLTNRDAVDVAIESALENAVEYADSTVRIAVTGVTDGYEVTIEDDGPGIPQEELLPIETGTETKLTHGKGLGLWQLRWSVDQCNGALSFETNDGTRVRVSVPDQ